MENPSIYSSSYDWKPVLAWNGRANNIAEYQYEYEYQDKHSHFVQRAPPNSYCDLSSITSLPGLAKLPRSGSIHRSMKCNDLHSLEAGGHFNNEFYEPSGSSKGFSRCPSTGNLLRSNQTENASPTLQQHGLNSPNPFVFAPIGNSSPSNEPFCVVSSDRKEIEADWDHVHNHKRVCINDRSYVRI